MGVKKIYLKKIHWSTAMSRSKIYLDDSYFSYMEIDAKLDGRGSIAPFIVTIKEIFFFIDFLGVYNELGRTDFSILEISSENSTFKKYSYKLVLDYY